MGLSGSLFVDVVFGGVVDGGEVLQKGKMLRLFLVGELIFR
jgi:hypothetical protein